MPVLAAGTSGVVHLPLLALGLLLPLLLLVLVLGMEVVERPLRRVDVSDQLLEFLDRAHPEEVETFVRDGYSPALEKYWRRRRQRLRPGRAR